MEARKGVFFSPYSSPPLKLNKQCSPSWAQYSQNAEGVPRGTGSTGLNATPELRGSTDLDRLFLGRDPSGALVLPDSCPGLCLQLLTQL